ncbi:SigE family RNA polymerase sigma factor [Actinomadura rupiterrae]|uniref:SigE family RNA polymerase sigma factor n=1 Tax=Actinomadura rupiterrae TaxID=559627 RepID=UPI0020A411A0|nr:SigE family RNA polymerase sigma factor [Actinomadura rupiterrae]MCP2337087.1 RNA polymerase sigma-70 factor (sigma-E family) [Actinomadura rupiterrae]
MADDEFAAYVTARSAWLQRVAYLLCQDWHRADDLVQTAVTRLYLNWRRAEASDNLDGYARTVLVRVYLAEQRGAWWRRVRTVEDVPDTTTRPDDPDAALDLREALRSLPARQRAVVVLRFYCDLSVDQTAEVLGCTSGTVKSHTARGLAALRRSLEETRS